MKVRHKMRVDRRGMMAVPARDVTRLVVRRNWSNCVRALQLAVRSSFAARRALERESDFRQAPSGTLETPRRPFLTPSLRVA